MRRAGNFAACHPPHFVQLLHQVAFGVQPSRRVDDHRCPVRTVSSHYGLVLHRGTATRRLRARANNPTLVTAARPWRVRMATPSIVDFRDPIAVEEAAPARDMVLSGAPHPTIAVTTRACIAHAAPGAGSRISIWPPHRWHRRRSSAVLMTRF